MSSSIGELCQMNERVSSFPPLVGRAPRVLVLGSMPGLRSLQAARYYAHPHNAFWPIMGQLLGFEGGADYDTRCRALTAAGVALWDVMASCERRGSLDSAIVRSSVQPNDIAALLEREPGIRAILFNGAAAELNPEDLDQVSGGAGLLPVAVVVVVVVMPMPIVI